MTTTGDLIVLLDERIARAESRMRTAPVTALPRLRTLIATLSAEKARLEKEI